MENDTKSTKIVFNIQFFKQQDSPDIDDTYHNVHTVYRKNDFDKDCNITVVEIQPLLEPDCLLIHNYEQLKGTGCS